MPKPRYDESIFINCPFDAQYGAMLDALIFAVHDCGFVARCALEVQDASQVRLEKIVRLIGDCRFGIHDISRTQLDPKSKLPRFNMPLELGLFLGAKSYGLARNRQKVCLILDTDRYRYQNFCSDIAGQDPSAHGGKPKKAIEIVRNWLRTHTNVSLPGGAKIIERYATFRSMLPKICNAANLDPKALIFADYGLLVTEWQRGNSV